MARTLPRPSHGVTVGGAGSGGAEGLDRAMSFAPLAPRHQTHARGRIGPNPARTLHLMIGTAALLCATVARLTLPACEATRHGTQAGTSEDGVSALVGAARSASALQQNIDSLVRMRAAARCGRAVARRSGEAAGLCRVWPGFVQAGSRSGRPRHHHHHPIHHPIHTRTHARARAPLCLFCRLRVSAAVHVRAGAPPWQTADQTLCMPHARLVADGGAGGHDGRGQIVQCGGGAAPGRDLRAEGPDPLQQVTLPHPEPPPPPPHTERGRGGRSVGGMGTRACLGRTWTERVSSIPCVFIAVGAGRGDLAEVLLLMAGRSRLCGRSAAPTPSAARVG